MKKFMKILSGILAVIGVIAVCCGIGTSDYYVIELGQPEPSYVWLMIIIGAICVLPAIIYMVLSDRE